MLGKGSTEKGFLLFWLSLAAFFPDKDREAVPLSWLTWNNVYIKHAALEWQFDGKKETEHRWLVKQLVVTFMWWETAHESPQWRSGFNM